MKNKHVLILEYSFSVLCFQVAVLFFLPQKWTSCQDFSRKKKEKENSRNGRVSNPAVKSTWAHHLTLRSKQTWYFFQQLNNGFGWLQLLTVALTSLTLRVVSSLQSARHRLLSFRLSRYTRHPETRLLLFIRLWAAAEARRPLCGRPLRLIRRLLILAGLRGGQRLLRPGSAQSLDVHFDGRG